jgi:hypothetical protein
MTELSLARAFPTAKDSDWQALVTAALKGAPLASLRSETYDGIAIEPLYPRATAAKVIPGWVPGEPWGVAQRADLPDAKAANSQILDDLMVTRSHRHRTPSPRPWPAFSSMRALPWSSTSARTARRRR